MNTTIIIIGALGLLATLVVALLMYLERTKGQLQWFKQPKKIPLGVKPKQLIRMANEINELTLTERLALLQSILGKSYKVLLVVNGENVRIESIGSDFDTEQENFNYVG